MKDEDRAIIGEDRAITAAGRAIIGLGANLGDPRRALGDAEQRISSLPGALSASQRVLRSSLYRSSPVDAIGPDYLNQVIAIDTALAPPALLAELLAIETLAGRERPARNAPRVLDLDLLLYFTPDGEPVTGTWSGPPALTLPHPRMHERRFVIEPLAEILPECPIPGHGRADSLLAQLRLRSTQRCQRLPAG